MVVDAVWVLSILLLSLLWHNCLCHRFRAQFIRFIIKQYCWYNFLPRKGPFWLWRVDKKSHNVAGRIFLHPSFHKIDKTESCLRMMWSMFDFLKNWGWNEICTRNPPKERLETLIPVVLAVGGRLILTWKKFVHNLFNIFQLLICHF